MSSIHSTVMAAVLVAAGALCAAAQAPPRLWAAQTGPDQVTLAWDSVPGAAGYRIYVGAPGPLGVRPTPPVSSLGGSSRGSILFGINRLSGGIYLVAKAANGRTIQELPFNPVARATSSAPIQPPAEVSAEATSATEVKLTWTPVPGATAYFILRAAGGSGYRPLCALCSTQPEYVDRDVSPGFKHSYLVAAVFPQGTSRRTESNEVTPGVTEEATPADPQPVPPQATSSGPQPVPQAAWSTPTPPTTATNAPPPGWTSTTAQTTASPTTPTAAAAGSSHSATPVGQAPTNAGPVAVAAGVAQNVASAVGNALGGMTGTTTGGTHAATPVGQPPAPSGPLGVVSGTVQQVGSAVAGTINGMAQSAGNLFTTNAPGTPVAPTSTPARVTPATPCRLDYQRADNMWAAFGRPDGALGTETLSLLAGQNKVFITDWAYEKKPNDGANYYGSHLRIATNPGARIVRLQLRTTTPAGLVVFSRTGSNTFWIRMAPGEVQRVQADLMEVFCEN